MKKRCLLYGFIMIFLGLFSTITFAEVKVSGTLTSNTTWIKALSPYLVTGNVQVASGITLTKEDL